MAAKSFGVHSATQATYWPNVPRVVPVAIFTLVLPIVAVVTRLSVSHKMHL